jgi:hypothetical protein
MQKPLIFPLAVALALTGCCLKRSQTWQKVVDHRAGHVASTGKETFADRLHAVLAADKVQHKIVTYQFRYRTRLREEAMGAGRAVIYRDAATPGNPWWVMDETTAFPVWVPDGAPERQLSFFIRRKAEVLEQKDFPADGGGKAFESAPAIAAPDVSPVDQHYYALFRDTHGTRFDPQSSADREKMIALRHTVALREL